MQTSTNYMLSLDNDISLRLSIFRDGRWKITVLSGQSSNIAFYGSHLELAEKLKDLREQAAEFGDIVPF